MFLRVTSEDAHGDGKGGEARRGGGRTRLIRAAGALVACGLVLAMAGAGWAYWHLNQNIKSIDIDGALGSDRPARTVTTPAPSVSASASPLPSGALNLLVLGSDSRSGRANAALGGGDSSGARSDTAMVVHVDAGRAGATVVSIPRDTLVTRPSCPLPSGGTTAVAYSSMFNSAYSVGGPACAVKTVESMTGIRMDHYLEIDFSGFAKLVDTLGGITVTDQDIDDDKSHLHLRAGTHRLDGEQALALARTRHGIGDGSDLGRIGLQQKVVKALLEQIASSKLLTDPTALYRVADAITGSLTTDTGLDSLPELVRFARSLQGLTSQNMKTVMMPVVPAASDHDRVVAKEPAASTLWESLR
ncbi:LCP family protein [Streptomyces sp. WAC07094]|uniref:LCP family protein n=1 Tax=Streptomyces sp. WAC07094 TaxID=3072183 RepID=UPI002EAA0F60|nr:LCP family protein [Streptomyces sp. WAC07094]